MFDRALEMAASEIARLRRNPNINSADIFKEGAIWARRYDNRPLLEEENKEISDLRSKLLAAERAARFYKAMSGLYKKRSQQNDRADDILFSLLMEEEGAADRAAAYFGVEVSI